MLCRSEPGIASATTELLPHSSEAGRSQGSTPTPPERRSQLQEQAAILLTRAASAFPTLTLTSPARSGCMEDQPSQAVSSKASATLPWAPSPLRLPTPSASSTAARRTDCAVPPSGIRTLPCAASSDLGSALNSSSPPALSTCSTLSALVVSQPASTPPPSGRYPHNKTTPESCSLMHASLFS